MQRPRLVIQIGLTTFSLLAVAAFADDVSGASPALPTVSRDKLLSLMSRLNGGFNLLVDDDESVKMTSFLDTGLKSTSAQRRRIVSPHPACECSEYLDTLADSCLQRRVTMVSSVNDGITSNDGLTPGSVALRSDYSKLTSDYVTEGPTTQKLYNAYYVGNGNSTGYLAQAATDADLIRNITTLFAHCIDVMWGQMFTVAKLTDASVQNVEQIRDTGFSGLFQYLTNTQKSEEMANYYNLYNQYLILTQYLTDNVQMVNIGATQVYQILTALGDNMQMTEDGQSILTDSLSTASNTLEGALDDFVTFIQNQLDQFTQTLSDTFQNNLLYPFQQSSQTSIQSYQSSVQQKVTDLDTNTNYMANNQSSAMDQDAMSSVAASIGNVTAGLAAQEQQYQDYSRSQIVDNATNLEDIQVTNLSNYISGYANNGQVQLTPLTTVLSNNQQQVNDVNSTINRELGSSTNNAFSEANTVSQQVSSWGSSIAQDSSTELAQITQDANNAPDVMSQDFSSNMTNMNNAISQSNMDYATSNNAIATNSRDTTSGIATSYALFSNTFGQGANFVHSKVQDTASGVLDSLMNSLGGTGDGNQLVASLQQALMGRSQRSSGIVQGQSDASSSNTTGMATVTESQIQTLASLILNSNMSSDEKLRAITDLNNQLQAANIHGNSQSRLIDQTARNALSGSGSLVAQNSDVLLQLLSGASGSFMPTVSAAAQKTINQNQLTLSNSINSMDNSLTASSSGFKTQQLYSSSMDQLSQYLMNKNQMQSTASAGASAGDTSSAGMDSSVVNAKTLLDKFMSSQSGVNSNQVDDYLQRISVSQLQSANSVQQNTVSTMTDVESHAAATVTVLNGLMSKINTDTPTFNAQQQDLVPRQNKFAQLFTNTSVDYFRQYIADNSPNGSATNDYNSGIINVTNQLLDWNQTAVQSLNDILANISTEIAKTPADITDQMNALFEILYSGDTLIKGDLLDSLKASSNEQTAHGALYASEHSQGANILRDIANNLGIHQSQINDMLTEANSQRDQFQSGSNVSSDVQMVLSSTGDAASNVSSVVGEHDDLANSLVASLQSNQSQASTDLANLTQYQGMVSAVQAQLVDTQNNVTMQTTAQLANQVNSATEDYVNELMYDAAVKQQKPGAIFDVLNATKKMIDDQISNIISGVILNNTNITGSLFTNQTTNALFLTRDVAIMKKLTDYYEAVLNPSERFSSFLTQINIAIETVIANSVHSLVNEDMQLNTTKIGLDKEFLQAVADIQNLNDQFDDSQTEEMGLRNTITNFTNDTLIDLSNLNSTIQSLDYDVLHATMNRSSITQPIQNFISTLIDTIEKSTSLYAQNVTQFIHDLEIRRTRYIR